jgi:GAF domain-containing protein
MTKTEQYQSFLPQLRALMAGETDTICRMANFCALLHETMHFFWTGFYRVIGEELVLGPFQGPIACTRIARGRGVCGTAWQDNRTLIVPDVHQFPGHIACSSLSNSEIVVPVHDIHGNVCAVLDIDSTEFATFDDTDRIFLEEAVTYI